MSSRQQHKNPSSTTITLWPAEARVNSKVITENFLEPPPPVVSTDASVLPRHEIGFFTFESKSWRIVLGVAALLDCFVTVWLFCFRGYFASTLLAPSRPHSQRYRERLLLEESTVLEVLNRCTEIFDDWHVLIGALFSLLWFIDAFLKAQWKRDEKLEELDRLRVLGHPLHGTGNGDGRTSEHQLGNPKVVAWMTYYKTIAIQLLLLPVGFYLSAWCLLVGNKNQVKAALMGTKCTKEMEKSFSSIYSTHSLIYSFIHFHLTLLNRTLGERVEVRRKILWRRMIFFAIRRPFLFSRRLRVFLSSLRLTKYIGPLVGEIAKFFGNASDLLKAWHQQLSAMRATRLRKQCWDNLNIGEKRDLAAIRIQCAVRGMLTRKTIKAFIVMLKTRRDRIARRLQKVVRASLVASKTQHDLMKLELEKLQEEAIEAKQRGYDLSIEHRRRMYQLQDELERRAKDLLNKHLLLQPNSRFAVIWKAMFVFCVLLDIAQQTLQPWIRDYKYRITGVAMSVEDFLVSQLIPKPISQWKSCAPKFETRPTKSWPFQRYFSQVFGEHLSNVVVKPFPWYCHEPYNAAYSIWIHILRLSVMQIALFVGIIRYLDVGITFFIGEVHPKTGILVAKSFLKRWIFPGLLLELLANPQMETTSRLLGRFLDCVMQVGPIRVGRWTLVGFYPLGQIMKKTVIRLWRPIVLQQNRECIERAAESVQKSFVMSRSRSAHAISSMNQCTLRITGMQRSRTTLLIAASRSSFALQELQHSWEN